MGNENNIMPRKSKIDRVAMDDLLGHVSAVENSMFELRFRVRHHFAARETIRERFSALEASFLQFSSDFEIELAERLKKHTVDG